MQKFGGMSGVGLPRQPLAVRAQAASYVTQELLFYGQHGHGQHGHGQHGHGQHGHGQHGHGQHGLSVRKQVEPSMALAAGPGVLWAGPGIS
jgi:hypothetical protein